MKKFRVLIADDHSVVRSGLAAILGFEDDIEVVGEAANGQKAVRLANELAPDVVIMDLMMPVVSGAEATEKIVVQNPGTNVLILTTYATPAEIRKALDAGATGALLKTASNRELLTAIRKTARGERVIDPSLAELLAGVPAVPSLTDRQLELLSYAAKGLTNADIAKHLGISPDTVKHTLSEVFARLGVSTRAEAVAVALRERLLKE